MHKTLVVTYHFESGSPEVRIHSEHQVIARATTFTGVPDTFLLELVIMQGLVALDLQDRDTVTVVYASPAVSEWLFVPDSNSAFWKFIIRMFSFINVSFRQTSANDPRLLGPRLSSEASNPDFSQVACQVLFWDHETDRYSPMGYWPDNAGGKHIVKLGGAKGEPLHYVHGILRAYLFGHSTVHLPQEVLDEMHRRFPMELMRVIGASVRLVGFADVLVS